MGRSSVTLDFFWSWRGKEEEVRGRVKNNLWKTTGPWKRGSPIQSRIQATTNGWGPFRPRRGTPSQGGIPRRSHIRAPTEHEVTRRTREHVYLEGDGGIITDENPGTGAEDTPERHAPGPRTKTGQKKNEAQHNTPRNLKDATSPGDEGSTSPRLRSQRNAPPVLIILATAPSSQGEIHRRVNEVTR
jgi:hypothetical protein